MKAQECAQNTSTAIRLSECVKPVCVHVSADSFIDWARKPSLVLWDNENNTISGQKMTPKETISGPLGVFTLIPLRYGLKIAIGL